MTSLCRDCLHIDAGPLEACPACHGARIVSHPALGALSIAHIDCDAFYASVEKRDNPDLRDRPVIVGGGTRGVVTTCCYIARLYGVRSAMPMFKALKACPDAVVIRPDFSKYHAAARAIRAQMETLTPLVEAVSIDEAYLDLSGTSALHKAPPAVSLARLALAIERDVGLTVSIGLSVNKFLAKTASELDKPRGFAAIAQEDAEALLARRPIDFLHGVGPKFAERLMRDGFATVADVQAADAAALLRRYGETGAWLKKRAHGIDRRAVEPDGERKSISSETTFFEDLKDPARLEDELWQLCVKTADRAKATGLAGKVITLKLKTSAFKPLTRQVSLAQPAQLAQEVFRAARPLLAKEANGRVSFRLIGIGLSGLSGQSTDAGDLLDPAIAKRAAAERASDKARAKFGKDAVVTGRTARLRARPDS